MEHHQQAAIQQSGLEPFEPAAEPRWDHSQSERLYGNHRHAGLEDLGAIVPRRAASGLLTLDGNTAAARAAHRRPSSFRRRNLVATRFLMEPVTMSTVARIGIVAAMLA